MTKVTQMVGSLFWIFIALFATIERTEACSCASTSIEQRFKDADYVFTAKTIGANLEGHVRSTIEDKENNNIHFSSADKIKIEFDPLRDYKGSSSELEFLYTPSSGMSCGYNVVLGSIETFFVQEGKLIGSCGDVLQKEDLAEFYGYLSKEGIE